MGGSQPEQAQNAPRTVLRALDTRSYHHGHPLRAPFPQGWTAERDGSLHAERRGYAAVGIVRLIVEGRAGIEQVKQVSSILRSLGAFANPSCGLHVHISSASVVANHFTALAEWVGKLLYQTARLLRMLQTGSPGWGQAA